MVTAAKPVAQLCAFIGLVSGFWHIAWFAAPRRSYLASSQSESTPSDTHGWNGCEAQG